MGYGFWDLYSDYQQSKASIDTFIKCFIQFCVILSPFYAILELGSILCLCSPIYDSRNLRCFYPTILILVSFYCFNGYLKSHIFQSHYWFLSTFPMFTSINVIAERKIRKIQAWIYMYFCIFKFLFWFFALSMYLVLIKVVRGFHRIADHRRLQALRGLQQQQPQRAPLLRPS